MTSEPKVSCAWCGRPFPFIDEDGEEEEDYDIFDYYEKVICKDCWPDNPTQH